MGDWKKNIDDFIECRRVDQETKATRIKADEENNQLEKERSEREGKLALLQSRFQCHICGELPTGPFVNEFKIDERIESRLNWEFPDNLRECDICHKYACKEHVYRGVCQKCAENLQKGG